MRHLIRAALALACALALAIAPARPAVAADAHRTTDLSWVRIGAYAFKKWLPWIATIVEEVIDHLPAGGAPPPAPPDDDPPIGDPEYTP